MKMIVLALVLAAAGCSKKSNTNDCESAIGKGIDTVSAAAKTRAGANPQMQERMASLAQVMKTTYVKRCVEDKWSPEAVACIAKMTTPKDRQECEGKLTEEQKNKLRADARQAMQAERASMPGIPGHPPMLGGSAGSNAAAPGGETPPATPPGAAPPAGGAAPSPAPAAGSEPPSAAGTPAPGAPATPPAGSGK